MRIFIGCTTTHLVGTEKNGTKYINKKLTVENIQKKESIAYLLSKKLQDSTNHTILPWWKEETIPANDDFFQRLQDLTEICEFGIFLFSKENLKSTNTTGKDVYGTNENVLIEYGLFLGKNRDSRTFQIFEEGVDKISDLIKYNRKDYDFENDKTKTVELLFSQISEKIEKARRINENFAEYTLIANRDTTEGILEDNKIKLWKTKFIYVGRESANLWGNIEENDSYISNTFDESFRDFIKKLNIKGVDNLISFGPGIGKLDEIIVDEIEDNDFRYIPIDINPYLSIMALKRITQKGSFQKIYVPTAIVDDFEENTSDLKNFIKTNITKDKHKTFFLMMGGTFGNLQKPLSFLNTLKTWIDNNDLFLLDAYIKDNNYNYEKDKELRLENNMLSDIILNAVNKKRSLYKKKSIYTNENIYNSKIVEVSKEELNAGTNIYYKHQIDSKFHIIMTSKRFNSSKLKGILDDKFKIEKSEILSVDTNIGISRAIYLLSKK